MKSNPLGYCFRLFLVFSFVFSYFIYAVNIVYLILAILGIYCLCSKRLIRETLIVFSSKYIVGIAAWFLLIFSLCFLYSIVLHHTNDVYYLKTMFGQFIQFFVGIFLIGFLKMKKTDMRQLELMIVYAFAIQSVIQLIVFSSPQLQSVIIYFNHSYELLSDYGGRRGVALASGTGWNLALAYGLVFIIYTKRMIMEEFRVINMLIGLLLFVGIFFAGRTGFVGVIFAFVLFLICKKIPLGSKLKYIAGAALSVVLVCVFFLFFLPDFTELLVDRIFPFAFEVFYKYDQKGTLETGSTNVLMDMWKTPIAPKELLLGTGYFHDPITGSYYKKVDIGILRNLFYWGIGGYIFIILYQLYQFSRFNYSSKLKISRSDFKLYVLFMVAYIFTMELKAMTIGYNRTIFSIVLLLSFFYQYQRKIETTSCHYDLNYCSRL